MSAERLINLEQGLPNIVERNPISFIEIPEWAKELKLKGWRPKKVVIPDPLSYCAGVKQSVEDLDKKPLNGRNLYHVPIHNETKRLEWEKGGARVVTSIEDIADNTNITLSAHGVSNEVKRRAVEKNLDITDLTCPLVDFARNDIKKLSKDDYKIILIGDENHDEIVGTISEAPELITIISPRSIPEQFKELLESLKDKPKVAVRTQTTLNAREVEEQFKYMQSIRPDINIPKKSDICYATQNRQDGMIKAIVLTEPDLMIIFGSGKNSRTPSSNTIRLGEVSESHGVKTRIVEDITEICPEWFDGVECVGVSAGASADPKRVSEFIYALRYCGLQPEQLFRITVAEEEQTFSKVRKANEKKNERQLL